MMPVTATESCEPARDSVGIRSQSVIVPQSCIDHVPEGGRGGVFISDLLFTHVHIGVGLYVCVCRGQWEGSLMAFRTVILVSSASCFLSALQK